MHFPRKILLSSLFSLYGLTIANSVTSRNFTALEPIHFTGGLTNPGEFVPFCNAPLSLEWSFCLSENVIAAQCVNQKLEGITTQAPCAPGTVCLVEDSQTIPSARCIPKNQTLKWYTTKWGSDVDTLVIGSTKPMNASIVNNYYDGNTNPILVWSTGFRTPEDKWKDWRIVNNRTEAASFPFDWAKHSQILVDVQTGGVGNVTVYTFLMD